jgi:uncharacterized membrane protein
MTRTVKGARGQAGRASETADSLSPSGGLQASLQQLAGTFTERAMLSVSDRLANATDRLTDYAESGGDKGLFSAITGLEDVSTPVKSIVKKGFGNAGAKVKDTARSLSSGKGKGGKGKGGKGNGGKKSKITNIVEHIDVGAPVDLVYRQWTQFAEFSKSTEEVEQAEQMSDEELRWKSKTFLSHRSWESTITEQAPNERIVWRSKGDKGYVDGAITFLELAPNLTRVLVVLEYHPEGLFERAGNMWRAQGRRVRLELKHFQRQLMTQALLHPDDIEGWQGDSEVVEASSDENDDEDTSSSNGKQRRTGTQRRTADGPDSSRKARGTASSRKSTGAASKSGGSASSRSAARTASSRSSSSRTGSSRRRTATK